MRWLKKGKIFDPTKVILPNDCLEFAQSPQALVFDDFVRIYFSTRKRDLSNGKYLSHIAFVDMKKDFKEVFNVSSKTVIELGKLGCFDEHGIFPMNVVRVNAQVYGYTSGWNRKKSVSVDTSIGLAISNDDGLTYHKMGNGPILTSSLHEPYLVGDPFVKIFNNTFHMWYIFGTNWNIFSKDEPPDRTYKIGHATSPDGIHWKKEDGRQIINNKLDHDESQALPTVSRFAGQYHMFFCYRHSSDFRTNKDRGYRIGYAYSDDLINWIRNDNNAGIYVSEDGWDSEMLCYPHIFKCDDNIYLLYNGNEFGRYGFGIAILE